MRGDLGLDLAPKQVFDYPWKQMKLLQKASARPLSFLRDPDIGEVTSRKGAITGEPGT